MPLGFGETGLRHRGPVLAEAFGQTTPVKATITESTQGEYRSRCSLFLEQLGTAGYMRCRYEIGHMFPVLIFVGTLIML